MHWILAVDALHATLSYLGAFLAGFAQAAAPVAVAALWQGAAIAAILAVCLRLAPRVSASHRFFVWAAGFAVVACLPFLSLVAPFAAPAITPAAAIQATPAKPWFQLNLDSRWALALAALWIVASALRAAQLAFHFYRVHGLWKTATPASVDGSIRSLLAAASPMRRPIEICTTPYLERPGVIGFVAPRILVPDWLFARLSPAELEQVVLHEAEHLRRGDDWINLLQKLALVLFPLNPALAWIESRLCREREMACDEGVVHRTHAPRAYAACLTTLAERGRQRQFERRVEALSLGAWKRRPELARRVHSVLKRRQSLHPAAARALVAVVGCGLLFSSVELARCPQMVAFVAAPKPQPAAIAQLGAGLARAPFAPVPASGIRAIETKAILPVNHSAAANLSAASPRRRATPSASATGFEIASNDMRPNEPRQVLLKAEMPPRAATPVYNSRQDSDQPYVVVLTAWEVVRTTHHRPAPVADYDTGDQAGADPASNQEPDQPQAQPQNQPATQYIVTRLILSIEPATTPDSANSSNPAGASNPARATKALHSDLSQPIRQPAAIPFGNGWLVLQL